MNINELYESIQDEFQLDELNGEYVIDKNTIFWSYNINEGGTESSYTITDDEESDFNFISSEELLLEAFNEDNEKLLIHLDNINQINNWVISDYEIIGETITFKIK